MLSLISKAEATRRVLPNLLWNATYATRSSRGRPAASQARGPLRRLPARPSPYSRKPPSSPRSPASQPSSSPRQDSAQQEKQNAVESVSAALAGASAENNSLLAPVHIPEDPLSILNERHPSTSILANSGIVVTRQLEMMNLLLGFEQANKYVIMDPQGNHIGYMAERDLGVGNAVRRQLFSTHRSFTTHVFDKFGNEVLRFHRPFSWISSRIGVYDPIDLQEPNSPSSPTSQASVSGGALTTELNPDAAQISQLPLSAMRVIGEAHQQWAPLRRKYNLFLHRDSIEPSDSGEVPQLTSGSVPLSNTKSLQPLSFQEEGSQASPSQFSQFAYIDERFLSWDFSLLSQDGRLLGSVNRNFAGFGREIFTDTGVYALRMDSAALAQEPDHIISQTARKAEVLGAANEGGMTLDQRAVMLATAVTVDFDYFSRHSGSGGIGGGFIPLWIPGFGGSGGGAEETGGPVEVAGTTEDGSLNGGPDDASPTARQDSESSWFDQGSQNPGQVGQGEEVWGQDGNDPWGGNNHGGDSEGEGEGEGGSWLDSL